VYGIDIEAVGVSDSLNPIFMSVHAGRSDISTFLYRMHCVNGIAMSAGTSAYAPSPLFLYMLIIKLDMNSASESNPVAPVSVTCM